MAKLKLMTFQSDIMFMKTKKFLIPVIATALLCPMSFAAEENMNVEDFSELRLGSGIEATVSCGESSSITLTGTEEALKTVKISDGGNRLKVNRKMTSVFGRNRDADVKAAIVSAR